MGFFLFVLDNNENNNNVDINEKSYPVIRFSVMWDIERGEREREASSLKCMTLWLHKKRKLVIAIIDFILNKTKKVRLRTHINKNKTKTLCYGLS